MRKNKSGLFLLYLLGAAFLVMVLNTNLKMRARLTKLNDTTIFSDEFRSHEIGEENLKILKEMQPEDQGTSAALMMLGGFENGEEKLWTSRPAWRAYRDACCAIWNEAIYFPVPNSTVHEEYQVHFTDSWMNERTYGGKRGHEGTDLMASKDVPGLYPVVSISDGTVMNKGWLERGGYRIGILSAQGGYYYYAHLDSYADLEEGDTVCAGDLIGFMGNTGYGEEGTKGMFPTHLHIGIYLYPGENEISVNPYWILRTLEEKKLSCSF